MKRIFGVVLPLVVMLIASAGAAWANGNDSYVAIKGGAFLPNSKDGSTTSSNRGFGNFATGWNGEIAAGYRPESYAAVELGLGYFATDATISDATAGTNNKYKAFSVPVTVTAKGILPLGRLECFAGAGLGYWFGQVNYRHFAASGAKDLERNVNAGAVGYQLVTGADYRVTERLDLGAEVKWASVKPEFDQVETAGTKVKWEFGGTNVNLVLKYRF